AVRHLSASLGVMITASHNPPRDNGYKVYLGDGDEGAQLCSPDDHTIAEHIRDIAAAPLSAIPKNPGYERAGQDLIDAYVEAVSREVAGPRTGPQGEQF